MSENNVPLRIDIENELKKTGKPQGHSTKTQKKERNQTRKAQVHIWLLEKLQDEDRVKVLSDLPGYENWEVEEEDAEV